MKINCICGNVLRDQTDHIPYKAHFVADQDYEDQLVGIEQQLARILTQGSGSADEALAAARLRPPRAVLLDAAMPGLDGYALARQLRLLPGMTDVLIICVSGYGTPDHRRCPRRGRQALHNRPPDFQFRISQNGLYFLPAHAVLDRVEATSLANGRQGSSLWVKSRPAFCCVGKLSLFRIRVVYLLPPGPCSGAG
jgi:CheY-like chemotaxis protein